MKIHVVLWVVA